MKQAIFERQASLIGPQPQTVKLCLHNTAVKESLSHTVSIPSNIHKTQVESHNRIYFSDTEKSDPNAYEVYTDFANPKLGGGWKGYGFAQEEIAFIECRGLAEAAEFAKDARILLRDQKGTPNPILIQGTERVGRYTEYGQVARNNAMKIERNPSLVNQKLVQAEPKQVDWLAMAAPEFKYKADARTPMALADLFRNAHSAFKLAKREAKAKGQPLKIHTGQWGSGFFNNDPFFSLVAQVAAAKVAGVNNIVFHKYEEPVVQAAIGIADRALQNTRTGDIEEIAENMFYELQ